MGAVVSLAWNVREIKGGGRGRWVESGEVGPWDESEVRDLEQEGTECIPKGGLSLDAGTTAAK